MYSYLIGENINSSKDIYVENLINNLAIIGEPGSGKSIMLLNLLKQNINNGGGVIYIDQKGDLTNYKEFIIYSKKANRKQDILTFDFNNISSTIDFNILFDAIINNKLIYITIPCLKISVVKCEEIINYIIDKIKEVLSKLFEENVKIKNSLPFLLIFDEASSYINKISEILSKSRGLNIANVVSLQEIPNILEDFDKVFDNITTKIILRTNSLCNLNKIKEFVGAEENIEELIKFLNYAKCGEGIILSNSLTKIKINY